VCVIDLTSFLVKVLSEFFRVFQIIKLIFDIVVDTGGGFHPFNFTKIC